MELLPWSGIHEIVGYDGSFMGEEIILLAFFVFASVGMEFRNMWMGRTKVW